VELKEYIGGVERIANEARAAGEVGDVGRIVCYVRFIILVPSLGLQVQQPVYERESSLEPQGTPNLH